MKILFAADIGTDTDIDLTVETATEDEKVSTREKDYIDSVMAGVSENRAAIDEKIAEFAKGWRLERMAGVDRSIMRIAVYEMFFATNKLKPSIAINEAVELAKGYGTDDSARFVNGVLGAMARATTTR